MSQNKKTFKSASPATATYGTYIHTLNFCQEDGCGYNKQYSGLSFTPSVINITTFLKTKDDNYQFNVNSNTPFLPLSINSSQFNLLSEQYLYTLSKGKIKIVSGKVTEIRESITNPNINLTNNTLVISHFINEFLFPLSSAAGFKFEIKISQESSYDGEGKDAVFYPGSSASVILEYRV